MILTIKTRDARGGYLLEQVIGPREACERMRTKRIAKFTEMRSKDERVKHTLNHVDFELSEDDDILIKMEDEDLGVLLTPIGTIRLYPVKKGSYIYAVSETFTADNTAAYVVGEGTDLFDVVEKATKWAVETLQDFQQ